MRAALFSLLLFTPLCSIERPLKLDDLAANYCEFNKSSSPEEVKREVKPYLLPKEHRASNALHAIFSEKGVLASIGSMQAAGFVILLYRERGGLILAKHPLLKNFLVKAYLDTATHVEWTRWVRRVKGRDRIRQFLNDNPCYRKYFKVPKKWIYRIPLTSRGDATEASVPREYVLLVEEMHLVDKETNLQMYKKIRRKALDGLYLIIDQTGFSDGHLGNLPFSGDGKIAFIDTEFTNTWPVHFEWLTPWFSSHNQRYWEALIENKGPPR